MVHNTFSSFWWCVHDLRKDNTKIIKSNSHIEILDTYTIICQQEDSTKPKKIKTLEEIIFFELGICRWQECKKMFLQDKNRKN